MSQSNVKKSVAIGVSDFKKLVLGNYYYVDKTLLISEVWDAGEVILMPRPRRFGKTLNLSMMRHFFEKSTEDNRGLFADSRLLKEHPEYRELIGKYPVIFLTFKDVGEETWDDTLENYYSLIQDEFERHSYLYDSLSSPRSKKSFEKILDGTASRTDFTSSLKLLCRLLFEYHQEKVIIILDEYDAPLHAAYTNNYYKKAVAFARSLLSKVLKDNSIYLHKSFISGILTVAKEGMFSGLNNLDIFDMTHDRAAHSFGFTEHEVATLLSYYGLEQDLPIARAWYDGYRFGSQQNIYNPWSVLKYVQSREIETYWANTGQDSLIKKLLGKATGQIKESFELLMGGQELVTSIEKSIVMPDLDKTPDLIWSLLLFGGYLTYADVIKKGDEKYYSLKIPNKELFKLYQKLISHLFAEVFDYQSLQSFVSALIIGDTQKLTILMQEFVLSSLSSFDIPKDHIERSYHLFVLGLLVCLRDQYIIKSNRESGDGRYDVMLIPRKIELTPIIIEFKKSYKKENLERVAQEGLEQIKEKKYWHELKDLGFSNYRAYGIAFHGKEVFIAMEPIAD